MADVDLSSFDRLESLMQARANAISRLATLSDPAKTGMDYAVDGISVSRSRERADLLSLIKELDALINATDTDMPEVITAIN